MMILNKFVEYWREGRRQGEKAPEQKKNDGSCATTSKKPPPNDCWRYTLPLWIVESNCMCSYRFIYYGMTFLSGVFLYHSFLWSFDLRLKQDQQSDNRDIGLSRFFQPYFCTDGNYWLRSLFSGKIEDGSNTARQSVWAPPFD